MKFTGIEYDEDCGFYAVLEKRIVCPQAGISGQKEDAESALADALEEAEMRLYSKYVAILSVGGAGSTEATEAHGVWMAARAARATQDAQEAQEASEGYVDVKFNYAPTLAQYVSSDGWEL